MGERHIGIEDTIEALGLRDLVDLVRREGGSDASVKRALVEAHTRARQCATHDQPDEPWRAELLALAARLDPLERWYRNYQAICGGSD